MSKLKPCPFCGGEAELCYGPGLGTDSCRGYTLYASCNECCAKSPGLWQEKKPEPNDQSWKDAADEWNSRPGEIDATKCGVGYCEHHREGLPVCSRCREESALAHDKACALLADARAEIERLKKLQQVATAINCAMLEADFDPEYLRGHECIAKHKLLSMLDLWRKKVKPRLPGFIDDAISKRDALIEQMREALRAWVRTPDIPLHEAIKVTEAALESAERAQQ